MKKIVDGNIACSNTAYLFSELCSIYPITPSSPMASNIDKLANKDEKNFNNEKVKIVEMQSEAGAAGAMHGALITGTLATTFTSSQGLLLMLPNMFKIAGEMLPGVIHVAARTVATHALSIFGDHSDIYQARTTGFCMLSSTNVQDAALLSAISHLASIDLSLPFLHFFDGFRTSHEINTINELDKKDLIKLINYESLNRFRQQALGTCEAKSRGMAENEDIYFQSVEARNKDYLKVADTVNYYMQKVNCLANTNYQPFNYYGDKDATNIIVAMGSVVDTIKLVVDEENKKGKKYGVVEVHLYRPFSKEYLNKVIPDSVKNIAVLDRSKEAGSCGEPLYLDALASIDKSINVVGGRFGLASKNTTPADILAVFNMLETKMKNNFTIGINDDVTNLSLPVGDYKIHLDCETLKVYGYGSDGMVSASKDLLKIVGEQQNKYVNGYFEYDSKKSGGVTISHLRYGDNSINAPYYVENPHMVVVTKQNYFSKFKIVDDMISNGILLINAKEVVLPDEVIEVINNRNISVYKIDAESIAEKNNLHGKISKIMEASILHLLNVPNYLSILTNNITNTFKNKGADVVNNNINAVNETINSLEKVDVKKVNLKMINNENIVEKILHREGYKLSVSELMEYKNGTFKGGNTKNEKRQISNKVPKWLPQNCIQCGMCSIVCPHAVIRPFATTDDGIPLLGNKDYKYNIVVSEVDCTGCGLCISACPGKGGTKALEFGEYNKENDNYSYKYFNEYNNPELMDKFTIKGSQLRKPKFEFSGACSGCGETSYIKLLTQLFGDNLIIANATGCSSIYGGSAPSTPYSVSWANSLFEDNAEFGYGMYLSIKEKRNHLKNIIKNNINNYDDNIKKLLNTWLDNYNDIKITNAIYEELLTCKLPSEIKDDIDYIKLSNVWAIGGDGWAYDIGFGGLDHVLYSNENIKVLVLDTEVYSNTGGQSSKSSNIAQVCEFANMGKKTIKKDLFKYAMTIPNCYVASINLEANPFQAIKAMKEASLHDGPAMIIAYAPCIEHGIKNGMSCSLEESKLAVEVGYSLLMRYNPSDNKLNIDSKEPKFDDYEKFLNNEVRYNSLMLKDINLANELIKIQKENAINRYNYYKDLSDNK